MRIVIFLLFAGALGFAAKAFMRTGQPDAKAEFQFEKETHDFGKVGQGKTVSVEFKFTNIGNAPLIITKAESTASNASATFSSSPVNKGETGSVIVKFIAGNQQQAFIKAVTVHSNAKTPVKVLYIKGEIVASGAAAM